MRFSPWTMTFAFLAAPGFKRKSQLLQGSVVVHVPQLHRKLHTNIWIGSVDIDMYKTKVKVRSIHRSTCLNSSPRHHSPLVEQLQADHQRLCISCENFHP